ncbi:DUF6802 family protein [Rhodococcoides kyotonense]|uniref:DUF6802 domain-containing protein n=1 Tax=Rhodococcoides kyotonense TaxID=398843 RepID=A0A239JCA1_9NOCA|nr:DUF6802 family protein [Rhodococcus kyotonensis]SNT03232.1 hypothetical protein SAMN05421642_108145 [Rhodococcus kyotonensis]
MDIDDALLLDQEPHEDADRFAPGIEMFDVDGNGVDETRVVHTDAGVTVATDRNEDGVMDTFTSVARDGHYETWEVFRVADGTSRWDRIDSGELF